MTETNETTKRPFWRLRNIERMAFAAVILGIIGYLVFENRTLNTTVNLSTRSQKELQTKLAALDAFHSRMILKEDLTKKLPSGLSYGEKLILTEAVLDASVKYKIDADIILAIIEVESRFTRDAQNPSGATGYMQLMPSTFNSIAKKYGIVGVVDEPYANITVGCAYLHHLRGLYSGKRMNESAIWIRILNQYATGIDSPQASFYSNRVLNKVEGKS